ncbi:MAG: peptide chain release factor 2 [Clostridia bacterium]|nr:peptide chain release factor 2 [Clostridia bacterium]
MHFDIAGIEKEIAELDEQAAAPGFWDDMKNSQAVLQKSKNLKDKLEAFRDIETSQEDALMMIEMAEEEGDASLVGEIADTVKKLTEQIDKMRLATLLSGKYDSSNAILTFHAGAGGTEAQDWCEMLIRMYQMWAQKNGYKSEIMDSLPGDEAGIKSCTMEIAGMNAYGYLKAEKGIHRLVRISPFNSQGKRMTSFASVEVMPELDDNIEVDIRPEDVKMDVFRASGAGGQHINKTSSAVRLTHVPTGIVTSCQTQRSQLQNREYAMKMLKAKLVELAEQQQKETISEIKGVQTDNGWGNQIRSYVFQPYTMVKDLRTGYEMGNIGAVMDGELNGFINAYLTAANLGTLKK